MSACPSCGLANYDGLCPHCRGDEDAYEHELAPPFPSRVAEGEIDFIGTGASVCDFDGHEWGDAGGGLDICIRCEEERFTG